MANIANPLPYITKRESGLLCDLKTNLFNKRLNASKNLYRRDLVCHFGCVNAIEFSYNGELLVSGGDDRRVMLWQFGQAVLNYGKPESMKALHLSNIFCLGITSDNQKIFSGGNDDRVIVHDLESKSPLEVLQHQRAVSSLSIDPFNEQVVATAGNDGRLLLFDTRQSVHESLVVSRSRRAFHGVMYHPQQVSMLVSANERNGVALWDLRSPKHPVIRYVGSKGSTQNGMSVCFNHLGTHIVALRRRLPPVLYAVHSPEPLAEFYHQDYYNSCTMKSCCFAGKNDQFVLSGSDDFNLYMWKIPDTGGGCNDMLVEPPHLVLYGHRSIVNQVRYNPHYCLIASSGVEKIIKLWSALQYPDMRGTLLEEAQGPDNPREIYTHEDYVSLVHHSGQYLSHNYAEQSTSEDPRMMAFFDSLMQRELECLAEDTDSLDGSSSRSARDSGSDSSDSDQIAVDFPSLPPKRRCPSQRCQNRLARLVASRYPKNVRSQKRGALRRNKQPRTCVNKSSTTVKGARPARRARGRRPATTRRLSPSSERTDSDESAYCMYRSTGRILRPARRRMNSTRSNKRKCKVTCYRRSMNLRSNGNGAAQDSSDNNNVENVDTFEENLALPSTSTGYRGQNNSLFRIAEVDSDDDQSVSSRPRSVRSQNQSIPNLVNIVPTPINGSIGDSFRNDNQESESNNSSPPPETRLRMNLRRVRRNGRQAMNRSDSSGSPPMKTQADRALTERLSPKGFNRTLARLMNETNESELESSCSTEGSLWPAPDTLGTPDSGVGTVAGSSTRNPLPADEVSDDPEFQAYKFRQRVKKARRNYRNHMESDSN
nr:DDB1- and CUL4-associated factor 5 isoform X2 [Danaus plexippus plexippus]